MTLNEEAETMGTGERPRDRAAADPRADRDGRQLRLLLRAVPERARLAASRLLHAAHALARSSGRTEVTCEWFFEPETIAREDFDPSDAVDFWDMVNRQDWYVCELAQKGVRTKGYTAGRYSAEEADTHAFDLMVAGRYMEALREGVTA